MGPASTDDTKRSDQWQQQSSRLSWIVPQINIFIGKRDWLASTSSHDFPYGVQQLHTVAFMTNKLFGWQLLANGVTRDYTVGSRFPITNT
jgi:hypothetical protein